MARLRYERDTGAELCPDESMLRDAVSARLGYVPFDDEATTTVAVRITRKARTLEARVRVDARDGSEPRTRALSSAAADCDQLASGVALAVSIAIDPLSLTRPAPAPVSAPAPAPVPAPEPAPESPLPPGEGQGEGQEKPAQQSTTTTTEEKENGAFALRIGADLLGTLGATPTLTAALAGTVQLRASVWSTALELRGDYPAAENDTRATRALAQLVPCGHVGWGFACGVASLGVLRARGDGIEPANTEHTFYAGLGGRIGVEVRVDRALSLRGYGEGVGTLTKIALQVAEREVWRTPAATVSVGVGLVGDLP